MATVRHPKASAFVHQRLFAGLSSFTELEERIANLPDEKSRGDAFEVFAEAYLATQRKHDAETVWPLANVPIEILTNLQLATQDYGVDGVLKSRLGKLSAYQVKFRAGRPALTWRELSTFIALADSPDIRSRILLTNCVELPSVLNDRQGFFCIRGSDLDRLETEDFKTIAAWLANSVYQAPRKTPQPHQAEALDKILPAFKEHDRVSAIMACGTGKTLVALWVAENVARVSLSAGSGGSPAARILVLLPSLALVRQTLHEWLRETSLPSLAYLCVCSDVTVKQNLDTLVTLQSDLDFEISTKPENVRAFLDADFAGAKIVFCTYQSASVAGEAMQPGEIFDLGIFDEAHKTAGREGRNFAFALGDKNLPIRKRLFLTATPRHYNLQKRDMEGESKLVFSMDRSEVYGPQVYRLTFAEAARQEIICGYKVVISVITSEMVTNELLSRGEVLVNGDSVLARQVANQIALRDAVEKYGVRKIFTFHKTVNSAASFVAAGNEGVRAHLPEFQTFHVNGTMPTARREHAMRDFRAAPLAVMSNARCLTEGVDVPAVDMVAFLSPRRSLVDIVQATGRAIRRLPGKTTGYVLLPLYVELAAGETVGTATSRANFDEVWDVLQTMLEQDDVLADYISRLASEKGRTGKLNGTPCEQIEIIGDAVSLITLKDAIQARCFEELFPSWDKSFGLLQRYYEREGHCRVPRHHLENGYALGHWVGTQRQNQDELPLEHRQRLDTLPFEWDPFAADWQEGYIALQEFKARERHCSVPRHHSEGEFRLGSWVHSQRHQKDNMPVERRRRLDVLGFIWDTYEAAWDEGFTALQKFQIREGHSQVPKRHLEGTYNLGRWVEKQRRMKGGLPIERIQKLEGLGFDWDPETTNWQEGLAALERFKAREGHCRVPHRFFEGTYALGRWVGHQRKRRDRMTVARRQRLEVLGFEWEPSATNWQEGFAALETFKAREGHYRVPEGHIEGNYSLGSWVAYQRHQRDIMPAERRQRLESLGFDWDPYVTSWDEGIAALKQFRARERHCRVPVRHLEGTYRLGSWVSHQRKQKLKLSAERRQCLEALGFEWDILASAWEEGFAILEQFKAREHHCRVPQRHIEGTYNLGQWVATQRKQRNGMPVDRRQRLDSLGFVWHVGKG